MQRKFIIFFVLLLVAFNYLAWQEVFRLVSPGYLSVNFLDVGQGDAGFIETPEGYQILIDGGPGSVVIEKLGKLMPFWDKTIDVVILTHPEKDHMQGILEVLQKYKVKYFLWTGVIKDDAENKKLTSLLEKAKIRLNFLANLSGNFATEVLAVDKNTRIYAGDVLINIVYPLDNLAGKEIKNSSNDTCIVAKLNYGEDSFLFTGDVDFKNETKLIQSGRDISADVLKVAHHGSKYSTSDLFIKAVNPSYAVIEVGKNSYGHPTPEVLQRLEKFGIKIFRTDRDGDIEFISDGETISLN